MEFKQMEFQKFITRLRNKNFQEEDLKDGILQVNGRFGDLGISELGSIYHRLKTIDEIKGISLRGCSLKAGHIKEFFKQLDEETNLQYINLSGPGNHLRGNVKDIMESLDNASILEQLYLNDLKLTAEDWIDTLHVFATKCTNLKVLSLRGNGFPTKAKFRAAKVKYLRENETTALKPLPDVEVLNLENIFVCNTEEMPANIEDLAEFLKLFPGLKKLSLARNILTAEQATQLLGNAKHHRHLEELHINSNVFKDAEVTDMAKLLWQLTAFRKLKRLHIWKCDMSPEAWETLSSLIDIFPNDVEIVTSPLNIQAIQSKKRLGKLKSDTVRSRRSSMPSLLKPKKKKKNKESKRLHTDGGYSASTSLGKNNNAFFRSKPVSRRDSLASTETNTASQRTSTGFFSSRGKARSRRGSDASKGETIRKTGVSIFSTMKRSRKVSVGGGTRLKLTRGKGSKNTRQRSRSRGRSRGLSLGSLIIPMLNKQANKGNYNRAKIIIALFYVEGNLKGKQLTAYKGIKSNLRKKLLESEFGATDNELLQDYTLENAEELMELLRLSVAEAIDGKRPQQDSKELIPQITQQWEFSVKRHSRAIPPPHASPISPHRRGKKKKVKTPQVSSPSFL